MEIMNEKNLNSVDLNLLRVFLAIWESGSLTVAGEHLGLTQPAMSHALARLRRLLDDPLFVRTPAGMEPTATAERLFEPINTALALIRTTLHAQEHFDPRTAARAFRLAMSDMSEFFFLPPLLARLEQEAPGVKLEVLQVPVDRLADALRSREIDLAIGYLPGLERNCATQHLFSDSHVCMVRARHPQAGRKLTLATLLKMKHVFVPSNATGHRMVEQWLMESGVHRHIVLRLPHFTVAPEIVRGTDLAVLLPRSIAERFNRGRAYRLLEIPVALPSIDVNVYWHPRFDADQAVGWLRDLLLEMFGK